MDFIDVLKQFSTRVDKMRTQIQTEEATKTSIIMPFFQQVMGYDVFNPDEFVPEFTADVGTKKGEKVDYAIHINGVPMILVEAKWCGEPLDKHDSQLFRYFGTTKAKFAILTNGIIYKFYSDLDEQNRMDLTPFLEIDILNIKETLIPPLKQFTKSNFDAEELFNSASGLKYSNEIRNYFEAELKDPDDEFAKFFISQAYSGRITQAVVDKFKPIVKSTLNNYISELMNDRITNALKNEATKSAPSEPVATQNNEKAEESNEGITTTAEELEAFGIIKGLICDLIDPEKITFKDTGNYFAVLYDGKTTKWICRLYLNGSKKFCTIPAAADPTSDKDVRYNIDNINSLYIHRDCIRTSAQRFSTDNAAE